MDEIPERHAAIPEGARWSAERQCWEASEFDAIGRIHGEHRAFRVDGTLRLECRYDSGVCSGPFRIFHPNGELAREGEYVEGAPHGLVRAYSSDAPSPERLRVCCVPETARQLHLDYERGDLIRERFLDEAGRLLQKDGSLAPPRPPGLPENAEYEEATQRWCTSHAEGSLTLLSFYDARPVLLEEVAYLARRRFRVRHFAEDGQLGVEEHLDEAGQRHGAFLVRYLDAAQGPYLEPDICEERAHFEHGKAVGLSEFRTRAGRRLRVERGRVLDAESERDHAVFADVDHDTSAWLRIAHDLTETKLVRQALAAVARAAAQAQSSELFREWLVRSVVPLAPEHARELAASVESPALPAVSDVLNALLLGAEPAMALRALAKSLLGRPRAARDFVEVALLLAPDDLDTRWIRAMTRLELGRVTEALDDAEHLARDSASLADYVRDYARLAFPKWQFQPGREAISASFDGLSEVPAQTLPAIRRAIQVYATRLHVLREAARLCLNGEQEPDWLPPALPDLLPDGPLELRRYTASIVDADEEGEETSEVEIDETLQAGNAPLLELQTRARSEWAGLSWLCWAAGLERIALPDEFKPPPEFAAAASMVMARAARAADAVATGGLRARSQGAPDFQWEGLSVDALPGAFARLAYAEYAELRAVFLWLCFAQNLSPFQSDLRNL
jgi:hypothetical protein